VNNSELLQFKDYMINTIENFSYSMSRKTAVKLSKDTDFLTLRFSIGFMLQLLQLFNAVFDSASTHLCIL